MQIYCLFNSHDNRLNFWSASEADLTSAMVHEGVYSASFEVADDFPVGYDTVPGVGILRVYNDNGVLRNESERPATNDDVNVERQRRILLGKSFSGVMVTGRDEDFRNLTNLALAAQIRIAGGDTTTVTAFRDGNNVNHDLTPPEVLSLWEQASAYVSTVYETSWAMKDGTGAFIGGIPADYTDDANWP